MHRPDASEHDPYYCRYIDHVPDGDIVETLRRQMTETANLLESVDEKRAAFRYAADKWSVKEVIGHVIDVERVFATRGLVFTRGDTQSMPGLDQDEYARCAEYDRRSMTDIREELRLVRESNLRLFGGWSEEQSGRRGIASGLSFTARTIPWLIAGHEGHHVDVLRERYL